MLLPEETLTDTPRPVCTLPLVAPTVPSTEPVGTCFTLDECLSPCLGLKCYRIRSTISHSMLCLQPLEELCLAHVKVWCQVSGFLFKNSVLIISI